MLCIALQRYFIVCTNSTRLKSTGVLVFMLLLTWLVPIVSFLPLYTIEEVIVDPKLKRCAMGYSDNGWAKIPPVVLNYIIPYIAALAFYIVIQNHVRKSKKRVQANAPGPSTHLAVQYSRGQSSVPKPSNSMDHSAYPSMRREPLRNLKGVEWVGDGNYSSSDDGQKINVHIESGKPEGTMILVATASGTGEQQQGKHSLSSDDERKGNDHIEPGKPKATMLVATALDTGKQQQGEESLSSDRIESEKVRVSTPTAATVSYQAGKNEQRRHTVPISISQNSTSAAERQITKMMMTLFAAYTLCCMPITIMVIFSRKVPAEAFTAGQLLGSLNGALNPIVYGVMNKNIHQGYKHMWNSMLNFIASFCRPN
ncbi:histamine H1 receptor-like [Branchiostoma lanceolatum]|uniref:histamine H1 receptor-like n=1 Tax=Branchiostoma lanceolatum TaxID=7740 RepID=UPI003455EC42